MNDDDLIEVTYRAVFRVDVGFTCAHTMTRRDALRALDDGCLQDDPDRADADPTAPEVMWDAVSDYERGAADEAAMAAIREALGVSE